MAWKTTIPNPMNPRKAPVEVYANLEEIHWSKGRRELVGVFNCYESAEAAALAETGEAVALLKQIRLLITPDANITQRKIEHPTEKLPDGSPVVLVPERKTRPYNAVLAEHLVLFDALKTAVYGESKSAIPEFVAAVKVDQATVLPK